MQEALYYTKLENHKVKCLLCPHACIIEEGHFGNCNARRNRNGTLVTEVYGRISAINTDPIEKKPLYHFFPGKQILSLGTTGCNLHCVFCQNHELSQCDAKKPLLKKNIDAEELTSLALRTKNNIGLAFTYNEPITNYEYIMDTFRLAKMQNLSTVLISNGYCNLDPLALLTQYTDAFNIDLKGFSNNFYRKQTKSTLEPVLKSIQQIAKDGKHLEITNLVIPTLNDDEGEFEEMCKWIKNETGENTPLHISKFFPRYELDQYPTPPETLFHLFDIAKSHLNHVYLGNIATEIHSNTMCPNCSNTLIERTYFNISTKGIDQEGHCIKCNERVINYI